MGLDQAMGRPWKVPERWEARAMQSEPRAPCSVSGRARGKHVPSSNLAASPRCFCAPDPSHGRRDLPRPWKRLGRCPDGREPRASHGRASGVSGKPRKRPEGSESTSHVGFFPRCWRGPDPSRDARDLSRPWDGLQMCRHVWEARVFKASGPGPRARAPVSGRARRGVNLHSM